MTGPTILMLTGLSITAAAGLVALYWCGTFIYTYVSTWWAFHRAARRDRD